MFVLSYIVSFNFHWVRNPGYSCLNIYDGSQIYCWRKPEYLKKTIDLIQVTDKLYHIMLY